MRANLLEFLWCPGCHCSFQVEEHSREGEEILEGELLCSGCPARYPVTLGVPRIMPSTLLAETRLSANNFGGSWERFGSLKEAYRNQFLEDLANMMTEMERREESTIDPRFAEAHRKWNGSAPVDNSRLLH